MQARFFGFQFVWHASTTGTTALCEERPFLKFLDIFNRNFHIFGSIMGLINVADFRVEGYRG